MATEPRQHFFTLRGPTRNEGPCPADVNFQYSLLWKSVIQKIPCTIIQLANPVMTFSSPGRANNWQKKRHWLGAWNQCWKESDKRHVDSEMEEEFKKQIPEQLEEIKKTWRNREPVTKLLSYKSRVKIVYIWFDCAIIPPQPEPRGVRNCQIIDHPPMADAIVPNTSFSQLEDRHNSAER